MAKKMSEVQKVLAKFDKTVTASADGSMVVNLEDHFEEVLEEFMGRGAEKGWVFSDGYGGEGWVIMGANTKSEAVSAAVDWYENYEGGDFFGSQFDLLDEVKKGSVQSLANLL